VVGEVTTIGLDIAKSVFQVHGIDAAGTVVIRRQVRPLNLLTVKTGPILTLGGTGQAQLTH
jgi:hypothetical protein